jgi:hypothetical protein
MGTCRSSCSHATDLEYYDAWRKDQPMRRGRRGPTVVMNRRRTQRATRRHTKLWVCDRGCCSIRWKLDYAGVSLRVLMDPLWWIANQDAL